MFRLIDRILCGVCECDCAACIMRWPWPTEGSCSVKQSVCVWIWRPSTVCHPYNRPAHPSRDSSPLPLMACVPGAIMAHGDTDVARDDHVADVTIIPTTKDGDVDTKRKLHPEQGKWNRCVNVVHALNIGVRVWTADPRVSATWYYTSCLRIRRETHSIESVYCVTGTVAQHSADTAERNTKSVL